MLGAGRETISGLCGPLAARCVLIRQLPPKLIRSLTGSSKTRKQAGAWLRYSLTWHSPHAGFLNSCRFQNSATGWKKAERNLPHPPKSTPVVQHPASPWALGAAARALLSSPHCGVYSLGNKRGTAGEGEIPADFPSSPPWPRSLPRLPPIMAPTTPFVLIF